MATGSDDVREAMIRETHPRQLEAADVAFLLARLDDEREAAVRANIARYGKPDISGGAGVMQFLLARLDAERAECKRVRDAAAAQNHEVEDTLGRALAKACGFPPNYPHVGAADDGSVCAGEHTAETLALAAAKRLAALETGLRELLGTHDCARYACSPCTAARRLLGEGDGG